jgi:hypothetical protein
MSLSTSDWDSDLILRPGAAPPFVVPFCASCDEPVDKFTIDPVSSPFRMSIQAQCHGATQGIFVTVDDLFARKREGRKIVMFRKRDGLNSVR